MSRVSCFDLIGGGRCLILEQGLSWSQSKTHQRIGLCMDLVIYSVVNDEHVTTSIDRILTICCEIKILQGLIVHSKNQVKRGVVCPLLNTSLSHRLPFLIL